MRKIFDETGQAIAEFAMMLPVFVLLSFVIIDIQWMTKQAANIDYIVNEVARCEALAQMNPTAPLPCASTSLNGVSNNPPSYAQFLAQNLRLSTGTGLIINTPPCSGGSCQVSITYHYQPLGVYFPPITISRTGVAAYT